MDLNSQIKGLVKGFMDTNEYKEFKNAKKLSGGNKEFMKKVNEYKDIQFQIYQSQLSGKTLDSKKKTDMSKRAESISSEMEVMSYLKTEADFHNIMYNTFNKISEEVETSLK